MPKTELERLQSADIGLSSSDSFVGRAIRYFEAAQSGSARYSHAWIALGKLTDKPQVIESLWKIARSPVGKYADQKIIVYRHKNLTRGQRNEVALKCVELTNHSYGTLKIPLFALDGIFRTYFFTKMFGVSSFKVCSNLVAWAYESVLGHEVFGTCWRSVTPDVIDDYCQAHPDTWEVVLIS